METAPAFQRIELQRLGPPSKSDHLESADIQAIKTILLHLPKTGGTTLREALIPCFQPDHICPERFDRLHRYTAGELAGYRFFSGHFTFEGCHFIPGPKRILTMLRHPVDRLVSFYNFARSHTDEFIRKKGAWLFGLTRRRTMREFFSLEEVRRHPQINNTMVKRLTLWFPSGRWDSRDIKDDSDALSLLPLAKERLRSMAAFGILERFQESAELIFDTLGFPVPAVIEPRHVYRDLHRDFAFVENLEPQACDEETREVVAALINADVAFYQYGVGLFEELRRKPATRA